MNQTTIGLEIHVQLKTKSKMFCGCDNNAEGALPNTLVCPVCLGLPGVLPVANLQAIEWTLKTGLALHCQISKSSKFDRKHYFYPDLPKNYQISQYDEPFCRGGFLEIETAEGLKKINLTRIHLEEDAGKLIHDNDDSLVDLNRAGTPLMEIVTEPEISSPMEAKKFLQELRILMRYLGVSDADMEKGHLRCDANISIAESSKLKTQMSKELGTPVEIKNLNSFRMVERALLFEEKRQKELLAKGEKITKETRGWNDARQITYSQRSKEFAQDYRYFPEPDIPPFNLEHFEISEFEASLGELPSAKFQRFITQYQLDEKLVKLLIAEKNIADYFEKIALHAPSKLAADWITNELKLENISKVKEEDLIDLLVSIKNEKISGKVAKEVLSEMIKTGIPPEKIISEKGFRQISNEKEIEEKIEETLAENQKAVEDYKKGNQNVLGFLVGQVMKKTSGQADPKLANTLLIKKLNNLGSKNVE